MTIAGEPRCQVSGKWARQKELVSTFPHNESETTVVMKKVAHKLSNNVRTFGIDEPLDDPKYDVLDRASFAKRIFKIIDGTPLDSHLRIGIYGPWGSGKTTAINFIRWFSKNAYYPVATFNPWQFSDKKTAWLGFIGSIDEGIAKWQGHSTGSLRRRKQLVKAANVTNNIAQALGGPLAKGLASLMLEPLARSLEETKESVQTCINNALGDKRLFVFIDDLDRATPDITFELLMLISEIVDFNRCVYIIALDRAVTAQIIGKQTGIDNGSEFLEKIISWPFALPEPTDHAWKQLLYDEAKRLGGRLNIDALLRLYPLLPKTPRKLKHYLRYMHSLHTGFLSRFGETELNQHLLYSAQLFRFEYPEEFSKLLGDAPVKDLSSTDLLDNLFENESKKETPAPWEARIDQINSGWSKEKAERVKVLYEALREASFGLSPQYIKNHLFVTEVAELLTWKEYSRKVQHFRSLPDHKFQQSLNSWISSSKTERDKEQIREFLRKLIRQREELISQLISLTIQEEQKQKASEIHELTKMCSHVLDCDKLFCDSNYLFDSTIFRDWYDQLSKRANFKTPEGIYKGLRQQESTIAKKLATQTIGNASEILNSTPALSRDTPWMESAKAFSLTANEVKRILEEALASKLVERFSTHGGITDLWDKDKHRAEKLMLFSPNSLFHSETIYRQLEQISKDAQADINIQKNFLEFVYMLFNECTDTDSVTSPEECIKLISNGRFLSIIWDAATVKPINRRTVGTLEEKRQEIIKKLPDKGADLLSVPNWWNELVSEIQNTKN